MKTFYESPVKIRCSMSKSPSPSQNLNESDSSSSEPSSPLIVPTKKEPFQHCTVASPETAQSIDMTTSPASSCSKKTSLLEDLGTMEAELRLLAVSNVSKLTGQSDNLRRFIAGVSGN